MNMEIDIEGGESEAGSSASVLAQLTGANSNLKKIGIVNHKATATDAAHGVRVLMNNATAKCESGNLIGVNVDHSGAGNCLYLQGGNGGFVEDVSVVGCRTKGGGLLRCAVSPPTTLPQLPIVLEGRPFPSTSMGPTIVLAMT
ncbi:MAG: hypothetical protein K5863_22110 [Nitratireductor sp.]|uniref:hypothetical protein n=1 Tax=Nitratireductor sp. TaxID=1872084 RepID=UPI0026050B7C|nr:hypothetical protein [Nitratireductor sp.]MCV0352779.1 hypothetical protein [Nitratireductor sp.]